MGIAVFIMVSTDISEFIDFSIMCLFIIYFDEHFFKYLNLVSKVSFGTIYNIQRKKFEKVLDISVILKNVFE